MDHITALKRAVEMLDQISQGKSYDADTYFEALNQFRDAAARPLDISAINQLAYDNGIVITDWYDAENIKARFPGVDPEDIPTLLSTMSTSIGELADMALNNDQVEAWIIKCADQNGIELYTEDE